MTVGLKGLNIDQNSKLLVPWTWALITVGQGCLNGRPTVKFTVKTSVRIRDYPVNAILPSALVKIPPLPSPPCPLRT
jgi:hypothetical protein